MSRPPNAPIQLFHHRMPVILAPEHYDLWLDPTMQEVCRLQPLLRPYPSEAMVAYPVSPQVNHPAHDALDCMASVVRTLEARSAP